MIQELIALALVAWAVYRTVRGGLGLFSQSKQTGCASGCGNCGHSHSAGTRRPIEVKSLQLSFNPKDLAV